MVAIFGGVTILLFGILMFFAHRNCNICIENNTEELKYIENVRASVVSGDGNIVIGNEIEVAAIKLG